MKIILFSLLALTCAMFLSSSLLGQCDRVYFADEVREIHTMGAIALFDSVRGNPDGSKFVYKTGGWTVKDGKGYFDSTLPTVAYTMMPNGDVYGGRAGDLGQEHPFVRMCSQIGETWMSNGGIDGDQTRMRNLGTDGILFDGKRWMGQRFQEYYYNPDWHGADTNQGTNTYIVTMIDSFGIVSEVDPHNGQVHRQLVGAVIGTKLYGKRYTTGTSVVTEETQVQPCQLHQLLDGSLDGPAIRDVVHIRVVTTLGQILGEFDSVEGFNQSISSGRYSNIRFALVAVEGRTCKQIFLLD